jgi:hypothetical protein
MVVIFWIGRKGRPRLQQLIEMCRVVDTVLIDQETGGRRERYRINDSAGPTLAHLQYAAQMSEWCVLWFP